MNEGAGAVKVTALTAYPGVVPSARVRLLEMRLHLVNEGIALRCFSTITSGEYAHLARPGGSTRKLLAVTRSAFRAARHERRTGELRLVHRLTSLLPAPLADGPLDVYDFDDAIHLGHAASSGEAMGRLKREASRARAYMRNARLVLAGNEVLAADARELATRVEVIPSCVDPWSQPVRVHRRPNELLTLGWTGTRSTSVYLSPVLEAVQTLHARGRPVRLILMGADDTLRGSGIEHRPWSLEAERRLLSEIDIGVMPLPDDPWTRGKCGYKLLRYFSAALPTIAAPVGINRFLLERSGGLSASTAREYIDAIEDLRDDADARAARGECARSFVEGSYSFQVWVPRVAQLLRELAGA